MATLLQPSLHSLEEYASLVLGEAASYGVDVDDLIAEYEKDGLSDDHGVILDAFDRLQDAGYIVHEADDTLIIHEPDDSECEWCEEEEA